MLQLIVISFLIMLFLNFPIAIAMGFSSVLGLMFNPSLPGIVMAQKVYSAVDSFALMAIPFFMLAGQIMEETEITNCLVDFASNLVGHITGGLAHTAVVAEMILSGITGSAYADASALGTIMLPSLKKSGYSEGFSVSVVSAAATLGPIIPPSITMIIYGSIANMSVGKLFLAGYAPGFLLGFGYMIVNYRYAKKNHIPRNSFAGFKAIARSFFKSFWALVMPLIIIAGMLTGIFTSTEAGVVAVVYGLCYGFITRKMDFEKIKRSLLISVTATTSPMLIISVAGFMGYMLARENLSGLITGAITSLTSSGTVFYFILLITLLIMGMFIDSSATMLMLLPVLLPLIPILHLDSLHFAMVFLLSLLTAGITPPVGMNLFIVCGIDNTPFEKCVKPIIPFVAMMAAGIILIILFPQLVLWLPSLFA